MKSPNSNLGTEDDANTGAGRFIDVFDPRSRPRANGAELTSAIRPAMLARLRQVRMQLKRDLGASKRADLHLGLAERWLKHGGRASWWSRLL